MASRLPSAPPIVAGLTYVRPLGTGGFADVFLFEQQLPRRQVAVKVLLEDVVDASVLRMFNAEADVMARLSAHPSILTVYEASVSSDGRPYLVMEYCPSSLTNRYRREAIPVAEVLSLGVRIGSALETAHRAGLLHRDIKPSNVLVTSFGVPVLSDFGIATAIGGHAGDIFAMSVPWSAPEVVDEKITGSIASEVWSFGAMLYTLLAGRSPFEEPGRDRNSRDQLRSRIRRAAYPPMDRDDVPPQLHALLARTMSRTPDDRPATVAEVVLELQRIQHELGQLPTPHEIAADAWAAEAGALDLRDDADRGPARASVDRAAQRPARARTSAMRTPDDDSVVSEGRPRRVARGAVVAAVAGAVVVVALLAFALAGMLG